VVGGTGTSVNSYVAESVYDGGQIDSL